MNMKPSNAHYKNFKKLSHLYSGKHPTYPSMPQRIGKYIQIGLEISNPSWKNKKKGCIVLMQYEENRSTVQRGTLCQHSSNINGSWGRITENKRGEFKKLRSLHRA